MPASRMTPPAVNEHEHNELIARTNIVSQDDY